MATTVVGFRCVVDIIDEDSGPLQFEILPPLDLPAVLTILEWNRWNNLRNIAVNGPGNLTVF